MPSGDAHLADLATDTAVTRLAVAPGWYTSNLPTAWDILTPCGGVLMTVAMRAMQDELADAALRPLSASTLFCSPVPAGPLEIRVEVLRHGRAAAQLRAQLWSTSEPGPGLEVSATFGRLRDGVDFLDGQAPEVPSPENARPVGRSIQGFVPRFFENFDTRLALGQPWWTTDWTAGDARVARWFRYKRPQRLADGRLDPLALPPIADTMPPALFQRLGPERRPFHAPSLDLTVHFLEDTTAEWILANVHARRARAGYATADVEIWDDAGRLIAVATQMMMLRTAPDVWLRGDKP